MSTSLRRYRRRDRALLSVCALATLAALPPKASGQSPLDAETLTKFVDPLPRLLDTVIAPAGVQDGAPLYEISIGQFRQTLHSELPPTTLWGYNGAYPGPTFEVRRGELIRVRWTNDLLDELGHPLPHFLPYDSTLHGTTQHSGHAAHPGVPPQSRTVTHLHGGVVDEMSDGYPEHWFSGDPWAAPNGLGGPAGNRLTTTYPNDQRAAALWYHDHAMGATRLNVYAGLAGFYFIRDAVEDALALPGGVYELPLLIQDRSFYDDGSLFYPGRDSEPVGSIASFFLGDANLVNGVVWPYVEVEPRKYRLRLLNGANSRTYNLTLAPDGQGQSSERMTLHQIGTDGGLLAVRVPRSEILLAPSDRADVIVDFSQFQPGDTLRLWNEHPLAVDGTTDQVMQFRIVPPTGVDDSALPDALSTIDRYQEEDVARRRTLQLVRSVDELGRARLLLDGKRWDDEITEVVRQGELELWEIVNTSGEDHPIHIHLEAFQVHRRRSLLGFEIPLEDYELGWEDTFTVANGQSIELLVKFSQFTGTFVWHCHILEHEDHEMMRPLRIVTHIIPEPAGAALVAAAAGFVPRRPRMRKELR